MAHASAYHWLQVGTPVHFAAEPLAVLAVYSVLGRSEPALYHAQFVLDLCEQHGIGDFDLGYAYGHSRGLIGRRGRRRVSALARSGAGGSRRRCREKIANCC